MRMASGFIMLPRGLRERYFQLRGIDFSVYLYILEKAKYSDQTSYIDKGGRYTYEVNEGEFLTTKIDLARENGITPRQLSPILSRMKRLKLLTERSIYNGSIFKINPEVWSSIRKPSVIHPSSVGSSNKKRIKNKEESLNVSKDTLSSESPKISSDDLDQLGTPDMLRGEESPTNIPKKRKNTPPDDERRVGNRFTPEDLLKLWNDLSGPLAKCRVLSDKRKRQIKARLKENPSQDYWTTVIEKLSKSSFVLEGGWCSFDWLIKNIENGDKAFNGNYDNKGKKEVERKPQWEDFF